MNEAIISITAQDRTLTNEHWDIVFHPFEALYLCIRVFEENEHTSITIGQAIAAEDIDKICYADGTELVYP